MLTAYKLLSRSKLKTFAIAALLAVSFIWIIIDQASLQALRHQASELAVVGALLIATEICFIVGALIMAASVGAGLAGQKPGVRTWYRHLRYVRREARTLARHLIASRWLSIGFWINFAGAVGTSLLLILVVLRYAPLAGSGLLLLLLIDLAITFGWRIPVHLARKAHVRMNKLTVRRATQTDIEAYLKLQAERWNEDNKASREQLESRLKHYPQGMLVAERAGEIVGMVFAMRITSYDYDNPPSWNEITHDGFCDNVDPNGRAIFGVDLSTRKGSHSGDALLMGIARLVIREGVKTALLGGRLPGYHNYASTMSAEGYLHARDDAGKPLDPQVRFYTSIPGLKAIKTLPNYFNDPDSLDYGVLLRWRNPLFGLPGRRLWAAIFPLLMRVEAAYTKLHKVT